MFGTATDGTIAVGIEQARRTSFDFNRRSANVNIGRRLGHSFALAGRYAIERTRVFNTENIDPADVPLIDRLFPQVRLSAISGSLIRDTRDDAIDPATGGLIGVDGEVAARSHRIGGGIPEDVSAGVLRTAGSAAGGRLPPSARASVWPPASREPSTTTTPAGTVVTSVVDDLPASERFFAGGDTTVRGFALDRLGTPETIDSKGFPKGGHGLIVLNAELRTPVRGSVGAVGFVDAGNVFLHVNDIDLGRLRGSTGFGLRYRSPIGPIRVDLGFKLHRQALPSGVLERPTALHISLGQAF